MNLYEAADCADKAWSDELVRVYGKKGAAHARYDYKLGTATPRLERLKREKLEADGYLLNSMGVRIR